MSGSAKFDERDPFTQVAFRAVAITAALVFVVALVLQWMRPELTVVLFVPIAAALFIGALGSRWKSCTDGTSPESYGLRPLLCCCL
jgi:hypothetical protein